MPLIVLPKKEALNMLERRKREIYHVSNIPEAWADRVADNIRSIFSTSDYGWLLSELRNVTATASFQADSDDFINELIEYVNDAPIGQAVMGAVKQSIIVDSQKPYKDAIADLSESRKLCEELSESLKQVQEQLKRKEGDIELINSQLLLKSNEVARLKESIFQIEDINLGKIWKIFAALKLGEQVAVVAFYVGSISFFAWVAHILHIFDSK